jgi:hypothetical protein
METVATTEQSKKLRRDFYFLDRMKFEGRIAGFRKRVTELMETGAHWSRAHSVTAKEFGKLKLSKEKRLYEERVFHRTAVDAKIAQERKEITEERKVEDFERAVLTLPKKCAIAESLDWISAHPVMLKEARHTGKEEGRKPVVLSIHDILHAPHGPAPSMGTVTLLQHWARHAHEFFKLMMSEQKKKTDDTGGGAGRTETDSDLAEVERLLKEVEGANAG